MNEVARPRHRPYGSLLIMSSSQQIVGSNGHPLRRFYEDLERIGLCQWRELGWPAQEVARRGLSARASP
jgi:hypothetical protein